MGPTVALGLLVCVQLSAGSAELRLVGGGGRCAGRVEVKRGDEWGSVCVFDFDREARWAIVVCRQLGCGQVARASPYAPFGQGTGRIWLPPLFCRGTEDALEECPHFGWGKHFCGHERDVGVTCTDAVELRLEGGSSPCAGRVEVKLQGRWGSVGDDSWDMEDAEVVCQQLGCGSAAGAYSALERFGAGDGPVSLAVVDCKGSESTLWDCEIRGWGPFNYSHEWDTAVTCQGFSRLVGSDGACAGRLEVRQGRAWVGVCEDQVDMKVAQVVCRELGCGAALTIPGSGRFGAGSGRLWEGGFQCNGTEPLLSACARHPPQRQGCTGAASVICSPYTGFRLGNRSSRCTGRVEVAVRGTWGSVCASEWDLPDAHVLCRHLGCGRAFSVPPGGSFGSGAGPLRPDAFGCSGSERHPGECPVAVLGKPPCAPGNAAAVNCSGVGRFVESLRLVEGQSSCDGRLEESISSPAWRRVPAEQFKSWDVHMVCVVLGCGFPKDVYTASGTATSEMDITTEKMDIWGMGSALTSSPDEMDEELYEMHKELYETEKELFEMGAELYEMGGVPVEMGGKPVEMDEELYGMDEELYGMDEELYGMDEELYGMDEGSVEMDEGSVEMDEGSVEMDEEPVEMDKETVEMDSVSGMGLTPTSRPDNRDDVLEIDVLGSAPTSTPEDLVIICSGSRRVRLVGSSGRCAGRVEVYSGGTWSTVCQEGWELQDAAVVCRELGCGTALEAPSSARFGPGTGPPWPYIPRCSGTEESLWECKRSERRKCGRGGGAGAVCSEQLSVRLAGGHGRCRGFLEVSHNGTWGRVCANGTSPATAATVCRQLGCGNWGWLSAGPTQQPAPAWLAWVGCEYGAHSLWGCPSAPWNLQSCGPGGDAHVACDEDSDGTREISTSCLNAATCTGVPGSTVAAVTVGTVMIPTVLCVVLGTLLCRARGWRRGPGRYADANAVYEELDYTAMPEYQDVPSRSGSLSEGSVKKLPYYTGDSVEGSDTEAAPDPPARPEQGTPDGYDDALDVPQEPPAPCTGDICEGVAQRRWICVLPTGGIYSPPSPPGGTRNPSEEPPVHTDYDDVGSSALGPLP